MTDHCEIVETSNESVLQEPHSDVTFRILPPTYKANLLYMIRLMSEPVHVRCIFPFADPNSPTVAAFAICTAIPHGVAPGMNRR